MIGPTIKIKGDVSGDEDLIIEGTVDGSIELSGHDLTVGQSGHVQANLIATTVRVEGQVTGDITGSEKVIVSKSGRAQGNIVAPRVTLEDGAKFKGSIDMDPGINKPAKVVEPKGTQTTS
ncbi:MAG: polymer-forming cytoskeletal protein [Pseudomonadales bacterium]